MPDGEHCILPSMRKAISNHKGAKGEWLPGEMLTQVLMQVLADHLPGMLWRRFMHLVGAVDLEKLYVLFQILEQRRCQISLVGGCF